MEKFFFQDVCKGPFIFYFLIKVFFNKSIFRYKDDLLVMDKTGRFQLFDKSGNFREVLASIDAYIGNGFVLRGNEAIIACSGIVTDKVIYFFYFIPKNVAVVLLR